MLKTAAVNLLKTANDLRLLNSGPGGGFGELNHPPRQAGSSIMPGKRNPVIPEAAIQVSLRVISNDQMIAMAAAMGNLQLNHLYPLISDALMESLQLLINIDPRMTEKCITGMTANKQKISKQAEKSGVLATALVPHLGYETVEMWVNESAVQNMSLKKYILMNNFLNKSDINKILSPRTMLKPGFTEDDRIERKP